MTKFICCISLMLLTILLSSPGCRRDDSVSPEVTRNLSGETEHDFGAFYVDSGPVELKHVF